MKLGYFMQPIHYPTRNYHQLFAEDTEAILHAEKFSLEETWVGEHFTGASEPITYSFDFYIQSDQSN